MPVNLHIDPFQSRCSHKQVVCARTRLVKKSLSCRCPALMACCPNLGQGIGKEMRRPVCHFCLWALGARFLRPVEEPTRPAPPYQVLNPSCSDDATLLRSFDRSKATVIRSHLQFVMPFPPHSWQGRVHPLHRQENW